MEGDFGRLTRSLRNYESRLYSRISGSVNLEFALWCLLKRCLASNSEVPAEIPPSPPLGKGGIALAHHYERGELHWRTTTKGRAACARVVGRQIKSCGQRLWHQRNRLHGWTSP